MKSFYDNNRDNWQYAILAKNRNVLYPSHFHAVFEIFIVKKGDYKCLCNGKVFSVTDNCIALFDHFDIHSYFEDNAKESFQYVLTVPPRYLTKFNELRQGRRLGSHVIKDEKLCDEIISIINNFMPENGDNSQPYTSEAVIDLIFARLFYKMEFLMEEYHLNDFDLIKRILSYIENNFKEDISRSSIAKALGYTESHISRTFHKYIGHSIPHHINLLRIEYIDTQRKKFKEKNIINHIMDSGFKSVQSYYRNKKSISLSPSVNK